MRVHASWKTAARAILPYAAAVVVSLVLFGWIFKLWKVDLHVPFFYIGDGLSYQMFIKGVMDNPWCWHNHFLSYPDVMEMEDYPMADSLHFLLVKAIAIFSHHSGKVMNLYFLFTFPLTTLLAFLVFRRFQLPHLPSLVGSLLFAFTPYHFYRGEGHLFLAGYYVVPLVIMIALRICQGWNPWPSVRAGLDIEFWSSLGICILTAGSGVYYAFFSCFLLLFAGIWAAIQQRALRPLLLAGIFLAIISLGGFAQILPTIIHHLRHGPNPDAVVRIPDHVEIFALKINHLLFPMLGHRLQKIIHPPYTVGHDFGTNLGIMGGLGFLIVLAKFLFARRASENTGDGMAASIRLLHLLGIFTIACLLLATAGGFGYLFSWLVTPWMRCYYRISIFIAFMSLFGLVIVLQEMGAKLWAWQQGKWLYGTLNLLVLGIGLWDQTGTGPAYEPVQADFQSDAEFVRAIEARIPGQAIFQLPHVPWPEYNVCQINSYDPFRGYLHSKSLRWSGGAVKGRPADYWGKEVSHQPAETMVRTLGLAGFSGIWLDRNGYRDHGAAMEADLTRVLGNPAFVSANQRLVFFDLTAQNQHLRSRLSEEEWEQERADVLTTWSTSVCFKAGFSYVEHMPEENWRWCGGKGIIEIGNFTGQPRTVSLEMGLSGSGANLSNLWIDGPSFSDHLQVTGAKASPYRRSFTVPPGRHEITFRCDGKPLDMPTDPRQLVFRVHNFRICWLNPVTDSLDYQAITSP